MNFLYEKDHDIKAQLYNNVMSVLRLHENELIKICDRAIGDNFSDFEEILETILDPGSSFRSVYVHSNTRAFRLLKKEFSAFSKGIMDLYAFEINISSNVHLRYDFKIRHSIFPFILLSTRVFRPYARLEGILINDTK